ncbi:MAG: hypothetical protein WA402_04365, partial [Trichococcus flocculiformis]
FPSIVGGTPEKGNVLPGPVPCCTGFCPYSTGGRQYFHSFWMTTKLKYSRILLLSQFQKMQKNTRMNSKEME